MLELKIIEAVAQLIRIQVVLSSAFLLKHDRKEHYSSNLGLIADVFFEHFFEVQKEKICFLHKLKKINNIGGQIYVL